MKLLPLNTGNLDDLKWPYLSFLILPYLVVAVAVGVLQGALQTTDSHLTSIFQPITFIEIPLLLAKLLILTALHAPVVALGYCLGWILNAFVSFFLMGCNLRQIRQVYWHSELPSSWYKPAEQISKRGTYIIKKWGKSRTKGKIRFLLEFTLLWGCLMTAITGTLIVVESGVYHLGGIILMSFVMWNFYGLLFGSFLWHSAEQKYFRCIERQKQADKDSLNEVINQKPPH